MNPRMHIGGPETETPLTIDVPSRVHSLRSMRGGGADVVGMTLKQRKRAKQLAMLEELERGAEEARQREAEVAVLMEKRAARTRDRKERLLLRIAAVVRLQTISRGMRTRRKKKIEWAPKRIQRTWRYYHFMRVVKQYAAQRGRSAEKIQMPFKKRRAAKRSKAATALQSRARGRQTKSRTQRAIKLQRVRHRASAHILQAAIREHQDIVQKRKARPWQKHATLKERRDNPAKYYDVGKERRDSGHSDEHRARRPSGSSPALVWAHGAARGSFRRCRSREASTRCCSGCAPTNGACFS